MFNKKKINSFGENLYTLAINDDLQKMRIFKTCGSVIKSSVKFLTECINRNNMRRELNTMPDYLLLDIGLQRDQINGIVSGKIVRDSLDKSVAKDQSSSTIFNEQGDKPIAA